MKTITINPQNCVGCRNCEMACAYAHTGDDSGRKWANIQVSNNVVAKFVMPMTCFHCEDAWCMNVCPANAISRNEETGAVVIDQSRCAGCKMCILACPYGNIHFDHENLVSRKCDLCGGDPECVKHCIGGALNFEEVDTYVERKRESVSDKLASLLSK